MRINKIRLRCWQAAALCVLGCSVLHAGSIPDDGIGTITEAEERLYELLMQYRKEKGLEPIPLSKSLTIVAQYHARDLEINAPHMNSAGNLHSWSKGDKWSGVVYTADHKQAKGMWNKPRELTSYQGDGYEISSGWSGANMTADLAIGQWRTSRPHNDVMINQGTWADVKWRAVGVGIYRGYAHIWFGKEDDPAGKPILQKNAASEQKNAASKSATEPKDVLSSTPSIALPNAAERCLHCRGTGQSSRLCRNCRGIDPGKQPCRSCRGVDLSRHFCKQCRGIGKVKGATCSLCSGTGRQAACGECGGTGKRRPCETCNSTGKALCANCNGTGLKAKSD